MNEFCESCKQQMNKNSNTFSDFCDETSEHTRGVRGLQKARFMRLNITRIANGKVLSEWQPYQTNKLLYIILIYTQTDKQTDRQTGRQNTKLMPVHLINKK